MIDNIKMERPELHTDFHPPAVKQLNESVQSSKKCIRVSSKKKKSCNKFKLALEKPKRALSVYNIFYSDMRKQILSSRGYDNMDRFEEDDDNNDDEKESSNNVGKPKKRGRPRGPNYKKKSPHHIISLRELTATVSKLWPLHKKEYIEKYGATAEEDRKRYEREKAAYEKRKTEDLFECEEQNLDHNQKHTNYQGIKSNLDKNSKDFENMSLSGETSLTDSVLNQACITPLPIECKRDENLFLLKNASPKSRSETSFNDCRRKNEASLSTTMPNEEYQIINSDDTPERLYAESHKERFEQDDHYMLQHHEFEDNEKISQHVNPGPTYHTKQVDNSTEHIEPLPHDCHNSNHPIDWQYDWQFSTHDPETCTQQRYTYQTNAAHHSQHLQQQPPSSFHSHVHHETYMRYERNREQNSRYASFPVPAPYPPPIPYHNYQRASDSYWDSSTHFSSLPSPNLPSHPPPYTYQRQYSERDSRNHYR